MRIPTVTVLTAVHNGMPYLPQTVASIQAQTFSDWEYVIVDDASEDHTPSWIEAAAKRDSRIRLLRRSESGGPFVAANAGLQHSRGKYIIRTDADDLQPPNRIESQLGFLERNPKLRACISPWHSCNDNGLIRGGASIIPTRPAVLRWYLLLRAFASHSSLCVEHAAMQEIGGYAELRVGADFKLVSTLSLKDWIGVVPEVLSYVRRHERRLSRTHGKQQVDVAIGVMAEHMKAIAGCSWTIDELRELWLAGHAQSSNLRRGLGAIRQWSALWNDDNNLDCMDRLSLTHFGELKTWNLIKSHVTRNPLIAVPLAVQICLRRPSLLIGGGLRIGN